MAGSIVLQGSPKVRLLSCVMMPYSGASSCNLGIKFLPNPVRTICKSKLTQPLSTTRFPTYPPCIYQSSSLSLIHCLPGRPRTVPCRRREPSCPRCGRRRSSRGSTPSAGCSPAAGEPPRPPGSSPSPTPRPYFDSAQKKIQYLT